VRRIPAFFGFLALRDFVSQPAHLRAEGMLRLQPPPEAGSRAPSNDGATTKEALMDAAIIALLVAGSIAIYKSTGCGGRSAWSKPGGARPLCFPTDITAKLIEALLRNKAIPAVW
jgi:hypothetical protein